MNRYLVVSCEYRLALTQTGFTDLRKVQKIYVSAYVLVVCSLRFADFSVTVVYQSQASINYEIVEKKTKGLSNEKPPELYFCQLHVESRSTVVII